MSKRTVRQDVTALVYNKRGRLLSIGHNSYIKTHVLQSKYAAKANKPAAIYLHAELAALIKAAKRGKPHKIVVTRIGKGGCFLLAKPCPSCELAIKDFGVKIVEFT